VPDDLVTAAVALVRARTSADRPAWVTAVPSSRRPGLVEGLARAIAAALDIPFADVVARIAEHPAQDTQENSLQQQGNVDGAFAVTTEPAASTVLLVDDTISSGWTLTIVADLLRSHGAGPVVPFVLASTTGG
jgi:ATP-dependent DNA helicase RecQ